MQSNFHLNTGGSEGNTEVIEKILCFVGEKVELSCPQDSFIDMLPGGETNAPEASFFQEFCPQNHSAAETQTFPKCRTRDTKLLSR